MALPQPPMPQTADVLPPSRTGRPAAAARAAAAPACTECLVQASVGSHCVECAKAGPARRRDPGPLLERPPADARHLRADRDQRRRVRLAGAPGPRQRSAASTGVSPTAGSSTSASPSRSLERDGEWYRLVTSGFLHFGIIHLAFNMLLLFQLGQLLEPAIGRIRFGLLYFAALLGGSAGALLLQPNALHGGASGAVFGLMGGGVRRAAQPRRQPVLDRARHVAAAQPVSSRSRSRASRSAATSAASSAARSPAGSSWPPPTSGVPKWATYAAPVAVIVRRRCSCRSHRRQDLTQAPSHRGAGRRSRRTGWRGRAAAAAGTSRRGRASRRRAGRPRRRPRNVAHRTRRTAASSPGRPRGGPSTTAGSISQLRAAARRRAGCRPTGRRAAAPAARPDRTARRPVRGDALDERQRAGIEPAELDGPAGQRAHPPLDEERRPSRRSA